MITRAMTILARVVPRPSRLALAIPVVVPAQTALFDHRGTSTNQLVGAGACVPGDLNGDGIADFVERDLVPGASWRVRAFSGFDGSVLWTHVLPGPAPSGVLLWDGHGPFAAGDVNGDGKGDVVAGSANYGSGVWMISGADGSVIWTLASSSSGLGTFYIPEGAGPDLNGDGIGDVLVRNISGAASWGWAEVRSGLNGVLLGSVSLNSQYWAPIAFVPDATGDGNPDVIASRTPFPSVVSIYTGPTLSLAQSFNAPPQIPWTPQVSWDFGCSVGTPGDVTGDGLVEVAIGMRPSTGWPTVTYLPMSTRIMAGGTWNLLYEVSSTTVCGAGGSIESIGDIDGDGVTEFSLSGIPPVGLIGASVLSGPTGAVLWNAPSSTSDAMIVSRCVDLNMDGVRESFLLEPYDDLAATDAGRLRVVSWNPPPSASVTDLGGACGQSGGSLSLGLPLIGATCTVAMTGGVPFVGGNLAADFAPDVTTVLPSGCVGHLDPAHYAAFTLIPVVTDATGGFSFSVTVPSVPIAAGTTVTLQVVLFGTATSMGFDLSNGVRAVLGF
jgi:hypothetical protein